MGKLEVVVWRILFEKKRGAFARNLGVFSPKRNDCSKVEGEKPIPRNAQVILFYLQEK
jgi:hypothetical protein